MITHEVVWDGTSRTRRYLTQFTSLSSHRPKDVATPRSLGAPKYLRRRVDAGSPPLKLQVYGALLIRNMSISDLVALFERVAAKSKVYSAVATLRTTGFIRVVTRERRVRVNGSPLGRDVYGPTLRSTEAPR